MKRSRSKLSPWMAIVLLAAVSLSTSHSANALDLNGAWANNGSACSKIFQKSGKTLNFTSNSDAFGSGFIIENDKIRGKASTCIVKTRKEDANLIHLVASCSTDVALSTMQFSVKVVDENTIVRVFLGLEELNTTYSRCPLDN